MQHTLAMVATTMACILLSSPVQAAVSVEKNTETGLISWKLLERDIDLTLAQRTPDQTRAFFLGRGFSRQVADAIATACVFQAIGKNPASGEQASPLTIRLKEWSVYLSGTKKPVKLKEQWAQEWAGSEETAAAKLAFRWATFPTEQTFAPAGDYNWGMISFDLPPGSHFDADIVWHEGDAEKYKMIKGLVCPQDQAAPRGDGKD
ncbi:MAG: hypothetical protein ACWA5X_07605 [bacterium]